MRIRCHDRGRPLDLRPPRGLFAQAQYEGTNFEILVKIHILGAHDMTHTHTHIHTHTLSLSRSLTHSPLQTHLLNPCAGVCDKYPLIDGMSLISLPGFLIQQDANDFIADHLGTHRHPYWLDAVPAQ